MTGLAAALTAQPAFAHGFGQRYDLPVPLWLWRLGVMALASSWAIALVGHVLLWTRF